MFIGFEKIKNFHQINTYYSLDSCTLVALLCAQVTLAAPGAASIGRGALVAVTQMAVISPIASRTVPAGAAATVAEVLCSVTTTLLLSALPVLVVLPVALPEGVKREGLPFRLMACSVAAYPHPRSGLMKLRLVFIGFEKNFH